MGGAQEADETAAAGSPASRAATPAPFLDAAAFEAADSRMAAASVVRQWCRDADDMDPGEGMATRLQMMLIGIATEDAGSPAELTTDEEALATAYMEMAADYLVELGAGEDDVSAIFNDDDNEAAARVADFVSKEVGDDSDDMDAINSYVFGGEAQEALFDSALGILDATYKMQTVVRGGKKMRVNKRISGVFRMTGAQKVSLRKAQSKSHGAQARIHRAKSMKIRRAGGL
ncbi:MAG: hypothetical protein RLZZ373_3205 [Pseudomonadota bacterium]|jgi:hypothetical protein